MIRFQVSKANLQQFVKKKALLLKSMQKQYENCQNLESKKINQKNQKRSTESIQKIQKQNEQLNSFNKKGAEVQERAKIFRINMESWDDWEIKKLFSLYQHYGSQWKIIATKFPERSSNSIKNRFYTVIRNLLKHVFYFHPSLPTKIPHQISSKIILRFYESRQQFSHLKNFGKNILEQLDFEFNSPQIRRLTQKYSSEIKEVYELIFCSTEEPSIALQDNNVANNLEIKLREQAHREKKTKTSIEQNVEKNQTKKQYINSPNTDWTANFSNAAQNNLWCMVPEQNVAPYCYYNIPDCNWVPQQSYYPTIMMNFYMKM